jgi:hypothetical protein
MTEQLTPGQIAIKQLADTMLHTQAIRYEIPNNANPVEVVAKLQKLDVPGLLLRRGDSISHPDPMEYSPERSLYIGPETLIRTVGRVGLRASRWEHMEEKPVWERKIDLSWGYTNHSQDVLQTISVFTSSHEAGRTPTISRSMSMTPDSYEDDSGEYSLQQFNVADETVVALVGIYHAVFERADLAKLKAAA